MSTSATETVTPPAKPPAKALVTWAGAHRFDAQAAAGKPSIRLDASGETGPGPVITLLCALAACTCVDVVDILEKRRTPPETLTVNVEGDRFNGVPGRLTKIHLVYDITGAAVERVHAERAIDLAVTKYCSVRDSLDPNMPVTWELRLNGASGEA